MAWRFQKRIKILPGLSINLSKRGASVSAGPRGAKLNLGRRGLRSTVGIPGTGLSSTQRITGAPDSELSSSGRTAAVISVVIWIVLVALFLYFAS